MGGTAQRQARLSETAILPKTRPLDSALITRYSGIGGQKPGCGKLRLDCADAISNYGPEASALDSGRKLALAALDTLLGMAAPRAKGFGNRFGQLSVEGVLISDGGANRITHIAAVGKIAASWGDAETPNPKRVQMFPKTR